MTKINLLNSVIAVAILFMITGGVLNILHRPGGDEVLVQIGKFSTLILTLIGLIEVVSSKDKTSTSKTIWAMCFIFFSTFTVLVYFFKRQSGLITPTLLRQR